ncbi:MAG: ABC transporter substrate-binding protein [Lachnospirales bacterium]
MGCSKTDNNSENEVLDNDVAVEVESEKSLDEESEDNNDDAETVEYIKVTDSLDRELIFEKKPEKVVAIGSSLVDLWQLAGGEIVGTTTDSFSKEMGFDEDVVVNLGALHEPNVEEVFKLEPDLVILSPLISAQAELATVLEKADINVYNADMNSFEVYLEILKDFTDLTGHSEMYTKNGEDLQKVVEDVKAEASASFDNKDVLMIRANTTGTKAIPVDNFAVKIVEDMGLNNISDDDSAILSNLSIESIIAKDPYYIFYVVMGRDDAKSRAELDTYILQNPAWETLTAVQEGRFIELPKELFHNKPNARWGEAYEYVFDIRKAQEQ